MGKIYWMVLLAGIIIGCICMYLLIRWIRRMGYHILYSVLSYLKHQENSDELQPRSLRNMENFLLPQVMKDFPDFDLAMTKNQIKDHLIRHYGTRQEFHIYSIVLSDYRKEQLRKALVFQAAVCWKKERLLQKRLEIVMEFQAVNGSRNPAVTCPNCGAAIGFDALECEYCGTRINDSRNQEWAFTTVNET